MRPTSCRTGSFQRLAVLVAAALSCVAFAVGAAAPASAAAVVTRETVTTIATPEQIPSQCIPGGTGIISGTDTFTYTSVQTPSGGFTIAGTDVANGRIDWSDGSYSIIGSSDHTAFHAGAGTTVFTETHVDFADNYSAAGVLESRGTFYEVSHFTVTNGVVVRVEFEFTHMRGTFC